MSVHSLKRKKEIVTIENLDGVEQDYTIQELIGDERDAYLADMASRFKMGDDGRPTSIRNVKGMHALLISLSIVDPAGNKLDVKTIQQWPASLQTYLYKKIQEISGLGETAEEDAKND